MRRPVAQIFELPERGLIMSPPGDNSGSHRASVPGAVQTLPARIPTGKRPAQLHLDSPGPLSESHGMQEVRSSNLRSSTRFPSSEYQSKII